MKELFNCTIIFVIIFGLTQCTGDESMNDPSSGNDPTGKLALKITDAPIDHTSIQSCFITISAIKLDGAMVEGFSETTVDLLQYQKGQTFTIGEFEVMASQYAEMTLQLSAESAGGETPGCYILEADGTQHSLLTQDRELKIEHNLEVMENAEMELLLDFDLRKSIAEDRDSETVRFALVSGNDLSGSVRVIPSEHGTITGSVEDLVSGSDEIIVFAYAKGSFDPDSEMNSQNQSGLLFKNAVNSALVDLNGRFELHFLGAGDYELHAMSYERDETGALNFKGTLNFTLQDLLNPFEVSVSSMSETHVELAITDFLPL